MDIGYSTFLITQLAIRGGIIRPDIPYDTMWKEGGSLLERFKQSEFNVYTKSEYECMEEFLEYIFPEEILKKV
jgi:hypothetical protein